MQTVGKLTFIQPLFSSAFKILQKNCYSTKADVTQMRNELFSTEKRRQKDNTGRIEKIEIRYMGLPEDVTLVMNRGISTPYDCAKHLTEGHCKRSALAIVDGNLAWDMHRPLEGSCTLQLLNFTVAEPHAVNRAFWRTCSFMLGGALNIAFREEAGLELHSFPSPNIKSGSFVHDIVLSVKGWQPNEKEMRALSAEMIKLALKDIKIERLDVNLELAMEMFKDNSFKKEHLPNIASQNNGRITLYRMGDHIDISKGPMVGSTSFLGKCTISAAHQVGEDGENGIYRIQGVALPTGIKLNHLAFDILVKRSRKLNPARLPTEPYEDASLNKLLA